MSISTVAMPVNHAKHANVASKLQFGLWSGLSNNITVEVLTNAGFDWPVLDTEHSPNELPMAHSQLQAIARGKTYPVARPPWNDAVTIKRYRDVGVQTLPIPFVPDARQAADAVAATRYPPLGVLVQIETPEAIANIEAIAAVEGVDGLFIGPGDLASSMGLVGQQTHPEVVAAIEGAVRRIIACGKPAGILVGDEKLTRRYLEIGCTYVAAGSDIGIPARGAEALAAKFKQG
jgi:4-hydroxy-2-oxoheptanedioate aldolase